MDDVAEHGKWVQITIIISSRVFFRDSFAQLPNIILCLFDLASIFIASSLKRRQFQEEIMFICHSNTSLLAFRPTFGQRLLSFRIASCFQSPNFPSQFLNLSLLYAQSTFFRFLLKLYDYSFSHYIPVIVKSINSNNFWIQQMQGKKVQIVEDKLSKIVHQEGEGQLPQKGQEIFATYKGSLQNGTVFDSNQDRENPFNFVLGQGSVIKGWDQGFATMKRGEKATLICSPQYAYGAQGSPPSIPPNSTLNFEVQLLDFKDKKKEKWEFSDGQKFAEASRLKASGNDKLKAADLKGAAADYKEGIEFIENESSGQIKQLLNILRLNLSQAYLKLNRNAEAIENCTKVLKEQPANLKALYRRGVALHKTQDFEKAKIDFIELLKNDPQNAEAKKELAQINAAIKAFQQKQKKVFGQMFSKGGLYDDVKPAAKPETAKGENVEQLADQKEEQHQPQKEEQHQPQKEEQPEQKNEGHQKTD